ncbi:hypothetical protein [Paraburkholderia sp. CNPSo 3281]|uniref:hypothetical protein n=1 Tax=Paraburkholderia sp. CNPSo 3281 TaxID=2940933 RepID=UPI0020B6E0EA|nr:hypothetical protein [Paraburkholderia sp. CNPSo 3281]MCP3720992.1 hypothetical protein [Paraburkholderia sp. CNPSo 3281]
MSLLKRLFGILGGDSRAAVEPKLKQSPSEQPSRKAEKATAASAAGSIRLPSKIDDLMDFGLAKHSLNKRWSVGYWDPGPDAHLNRRKSVRLRDNTTGRVVAEVNDLERPFSVDVADNGIFGVNDAGPSAELSANLVIFDAGGKRVYGRAYKANLFGFSISPCGRYVASQTCNSSNEDSSILEIHDVAQQRVLASCMPVAGWTSEYTFEIEDGELKRVFARIDRLGRFAYSPTGEFLDAKKFMTARLTKGDPWTRIRAAGELVQTDESVKAVKRAYDVVDATISAFQPGQDSRWLAGAYRLKGELLEKMDKAGDAIEAYRAALGLDAKIGVKKRLAAMEKAASQQPSLKAPAGHREDGTGSGEVQR